MTVKNVGDQQVEGNYGFLTTLKQEKKVNEFALIVFLGVAMIVVGIVLMIIGFIKFIRKMNKEERNNLR